MLFPFRKYPLMAFALLMTPVLAFGNGHTGVPAQKLAGEYRIHLYFGDTAPFLDELKIDVSPSSEITGRMHVPNDFDADIEKVFFDGTHLGFEILVPKNASRPVDLVFRYETEMFPNDATRMAGFARIIASDGKPVTPGTYVASLVMFRKSQ